MTVQEQWMGITRETTAVYRLHLEIDEGADSRQRECLVRRAALADRVSDSAGDPLVVADIVHDAVHFARSLVEYDRSNGTGRGPIPATDPAWEGDPRGYVHQEHRVWVLEHDMP